VADPDGLVADRLPGLPDMRATGLRGSSEFVQQWASASRTIGEHLQDVDAGALNEISAARAVVEMAASSGAALVIGSSMPVRDVEWWSPSRVTATFANRGANGIDGVTSTALGVATGAAAIALMGDVTFLHDVSALVDGVDEDTSAVIVVLDNYGGGIFNFLPQAGAVAPDEFEWLFATPRPHQAAVIANAFGHRGQTVQTLEDLRSAIGEGLEQPGITAIVATMPAREDNVTLHHSLNEQVVTWLAR
jgi:2-succinyl-5-enolpyruvyl-6-hydroxy-3-cyclohexene-1-carboxylate synthase